MADEVKKKVECPDCEGSGEEECSQCGGSGVDSCANCLGTGEVEEED